MENVIIIMLTILVIILSFIVLICYKMLTRSTFYYRYYLRSISHQKKFRKNERVIKHVILDTKEEAEIVLSHLKDLISDYGMATVADFYDLVGEPSIFPDNDWGWIDISSAFITYTSNGCIIHLPKAIKV